MARALTQPARSVLLGSLATVAAFVWLSVPSTGMGAPIASGCWGGSTNPVGSPQRVNGIPNGCVWVFQPNAKVVQPTVVRRFNGRTQRFALPRLPIGNAHGICGVFRFLVQWPYVTVVADSLWTVEDGRNVCSSSLDAAAVWVMRWNGSGFSRTATSPPRTG